MKSTRTEITIGYNERIEIEPGVWENNLIEKIIKAEEEYIFQVRLDKAKADDQVLTKRFSIREHHLKPKMDYVKHKGIKYKIRTTNPSTKSHYVIIECGEMI